MVELATFLLVFVAVSWCTWVIAPLITMAGLERSEGKYISGATAGSTAPIYRFTTPRRLHQSCWSAAIFGGGLAACILLFANVLNMYILGGASVVSGVGAFQIPRWWVNYKIKKRQRLFESKLMELILGISSGLRAGVAFQHSLELVAHSIPGPVREEISVLLQEHRLGVSMPDALNHLYQRMPNEDLLLLITSVRLTLQSGGSLADVLDRIIATIRSRTEFNEKLRTMTAQGRFEAIAMASAPAVAFFMLFLIDRQLMMPMIENKLGWVALGCVACLEIVGFVFINKIVTIEV